MTAEEAAGEAAAAPRTEAPSCPGKEREARAAVSGGAGYSRRRWALSTLLLMVAVPVIGVDIKNPTILCRLLQEAGLKTLGPEGLFLFSSLDVDHDLYLSPEEFKPIAEKLTGTTHTHTFEDEFLHDPNGETLTLHAKMEPLLLETMTKSKDGFLGVSHSSLSGLRSWKSPVVPSSTLSAAQFRVFLPPKEKGKVGDTWWIIPSELNIFTGYLPNNRYHPPTPRGKEVLIHNLLSMFHPRPFIKSRFAPQGVVACVRALNDFYYDIVFRIHAEFQLNEFAGHIILSRDASHVRDFHLYVPNDKSLNVDMEWLYGSSESSSMEVDIGYLPQMELRAAGPSTPSVIYDEQGNVIDSSVEGGEPIQFVFEEIHWSSEISREEAANRLEVTFYPFKKVPYLPFTEAFSRAEAERKLVHSILLWGALDDQSCSGRTLRETVLESSPVLALLNQSFISSWSLVKELEDLQQNLALSQKAHLHLESYNFPVEMILALPNGTVVHHINANNFLDQTSMKPDEGPAFSISGGFEDPSTSTYVRFLQEGLEKAKPYLES
uniref:Selenoprotein N n=1 Tax=Astyanax mexicanus TaxID=7994 RepID=W5KUT1_ASTMX